MNRILCITLGLCTALLAFSLEGKAQCCCQAASFSAESAKKAFYADEAKLLLPEGSAPAAGDKLFRQRYGVEYLTAGCSEAEKVAYNYAMFQLLSRRYNRQWQEEVRPDVVGYKKWCLYQDTVPYERADEKPTFQGGTVNDFNLWVIVKMGLDENTPDPGFAHLNILLSEEGDVIDFDTLGNKNEMMERYMDIVKEAPAWTPGSHNGQPCKVILSVGTSASYRKDAQW